MITMKEIAKEAGVSRATVSYVLNGKHGTRLKISEPVIRKVRETARRRGYVRNALVDSVVTGKSRIIAVISSFPYYLMPAVKGCMEEASAHGCLVQLIPLENDINRAIMRAVEFRVAGIFAISLAPEVIRQVDPRFFELGIPSIGLTPKTGRMSFDQQESSRRGTEYLVSLGHRRIVYFQGRGEIAAERAAGYLEAMRAHGLTPELVPQEGFGEEAYFAQLESLIGLRPEALQFCNDIIAEDFLRICYRKRIFVPGTFSVLGFGSVPGSEFSSPSLSTVSEPYYETGQTMFRRIYDLIRNGRETDFPKLVGEVIERESTCARHSVSRRRKTKANPK